MTLIGRNMEICTIMDNCHNIVLGFLIDIDSHADDIGNAEFYKIDLKKM